MTELAAAGSDHRRAMWMRGEAVLNGAPAEQVQELRRASHVTRAAITRPHVAVQVLMPDTDVRAAATGLVSAAYRMRDATTSIGDLAAARESARTAHDRFVTAAAAYLHNA